MRVVIVEPGQYPRIEDIDLTLEKEQEIVGGLIDAIYPWKEQVCIICNDEGRVLNLPHNRCVEQYGPICGNFIIAGLSTENFCGLTEEQAKRYNQMFHSPEFPLDFCGIPWELKCSPNEYKRLMAAVNKTAKEQSKPTPIALKMRIPER